MLQAGSLLSHYQIESELGRGGMGVVFVAVDSRLNRRVALKILPPEIAGDRERRDRFRREALAVARLSHPNICAVFDVGEQDDIPFVAFEFIEGNTLRDRMRNLPLSWADAARVGAQCASALDYAHRQGITHRDVKPANIMLTKAGEVKLVDFGLAKFGNVPANKSSETENLTSPGIVVGTVDYMSPEQALGRDVDSRTDIFSIGVVLYELFAGQKPFAGGTDTEVLARILEADPPTISEPQLAGTIVARCLSRRVEDRYQTAGDLRADLQQLELSLQSNKSIEETRTIAAPAQMPGKGMSRRYLIGGVCATGALIGGGLLLREVRTARSIRQTVVVIPFFNATGEADLDYLADSLAEELVNGISQVRQLRVLARSAASRFRASEPDISTVSKRLGARLVVTGRVSRAGDAFVISAAAVDGSDGRQVWGRKFTTGIDGLQSVSAELTRDLLGAIEIKPAQDEQQRILRRTAGQQGSYELYLKGRYQWNKRTRESFGKAEEFYRQALDKDPNFALAWAGLADVYMMQSGYIAPHDIFPRAQEAALKAIRLDPKLSEGHASLAFIKLHYQWDWLGAEESYRRAIELNPNYATAHSSYARFLNVMKRFPEAVESIKRAQELDPLSTGIAAGFGLCYYFARDYQKAAAQYKKILEYEPNYVLGRSNLAAAYVQLRRLPESIREYETVLKTMSTDASTMCELAYVHALSNNRREAVELLDRAIEMRNTRYVSSPVISWVYLGLGDAQKALEWLERGYSERSWPMIFLGIEPKYDSLRNEQRFRNIMDQMHL